MTPLPKAACNVHNDTWTRAGIRHVALAVALAATMVAALHEQVASAYEIHTHRVLSYYAASRSILFADITLMADWGYGDPASEQFTTSEAGTGTARDLIGAGAQLEDDLATFKRVYNHFYDPQFNSHQGRGLNAFAGAIVGHPSPTWALEDTGEVVSLAALGSSGGIPQQFSFREAQRTYLDSLTLPAAQDRRAAAGRMFRTLGQVVHHLQDMAQPQHTRNDTHSPYELPARSFYERYTEQIALDSLGTLLINNPMPLPSFPTARQFWTENALAFRGMADFTARNYISYGTGYRTFVVNGSERVFGNVSFPLPNGFNQDSSPRSIVTRTVPLRQLNATVINEPMDYVVGSIFDGAYNGAAGVTYPNKLLGATSLLDKPLTQAGQSRVFTVNQAVFDDHYAILMPRAEAFSAGLLNHFFRGRLGLARSAPTSTTWNIQNLSQQPLNGAFRVYTENSSGARAPLAGGGPFSGTLAPGATMPVVLGEPPSGTQRLAVVFQGIIGQEPASLADPNWFAVAGKVINFTPLAAPCAGSLKREGGFAGLDVTHELGPSSGTVELKFEAFSIPDSLVVTASNGAATQLATTSGMVSGLHVRNFTFNPSTLGTTRARVRVTGSADGTWWTLAMSCPGQGLSSSDFPPTRVVRFDFGSAAAGAGGSCQAGFYVDGVFRGNAFVSASGGTSINVSLTKGPGHGAEFRNFSCASGTVNILVGAQYTDPGGTVRLQNMNQTGVRLFDVR
jgi:hypothetical protein